MTSPVAPPTARRRPPALALFAAAAAAFLLYEAGRYTPLNGDGWEYWYQVESLYRHGTPDLRPDDVRAVNDAVRARREPPDPDPPYAYATARDGRQYGYHYWAYALSAVPARAYLDATGGSPLSSLRLANAGWFVLAVGLVLFRSAAPVRERLALVGLAAVGPVVWYFLWTGAEVFSWALALVAVAAYRDGRFGRAGLAAGLAATQNPTLLPLGGAAAVAALVARRPRAAARAAVGTAVGLAPFLFFLDRFGTPSVILDQRPGPHHVSLLRTWGLVADLNQGLLPYLPLLVVGTVAGAARAAVTRNARGLVLAAAGVVIALATQVAHNWNSGCLGLQRYLVWMVPVAAGVAVEGLAGWRRLPALAGAAAVAHALLLAAYEWTGAVEPGYLHHGPVARWVLTHCPRAYAADPEVFAERQQHRDGWPRLAAELPVGFIRPDGTVTKLLLDPAAVERVAEEFAVAPAYLAALRKRAATEAGPFFVHPPAGAVCRVRSSK